MLCSMYKHAEQAQFISLNLHWDGKRKRSKPNIEIVGAWMAGSSVTKTTQLAIVSIGTIAHYCAFSATFPQVTENLNAGTVHWELHRWEYYSRVAVPKPFFTKTNTHLRIQWCKSHSHCSTKMWEIEKSDLVRWVILHHIQVAECMYGIHQQYRPKCLTGRGSCGSVMLWGA